MEKNKNLTGGCICGQVKYTITEILEAWEDCYGEDMKTEYSGFVDKLKEKKELEEVDSKND